jgi:AAA+ superfamily predicted ATPase
MRIMEENSFFKQFNSLIQLIEKKRVILEESPMAYKSTNIITIKKEDEEWHPLSDGYYRFTENDVDKYDSITKKNGVYRGNVTEGFKKWLKSYFDREEIMETPRYLNNFPKSPYSYGYYHFTNRDVEIFENLGDRAFVRETLQKRFKKWMEDEIAGKHKQYIITPPPEDSPTVEFNQLEQSQIETLDKGLGNFGAIYIPKQIVEDADDIVGEDDKKKILDDFFEGFKQFNSYSKILRRVNLLPSFTFILFGVSGTGKTSLARAYAKKYGIPIIIIESSRIVSSLLGETLSNINRIFDNAEHFAEEEGIPLILFFDEIDAIGSERGGRHDVGEIKRLAITFMQSLDKLNYNGIPIIVFGASNHESLLDKAIWRRFTFHLNFTYPTYFQRKKILESYLKKLRSVEEELSSINIDDNIESKMKNEWEILIDAIKKEKVEDIPEFPSDDKIEEGSAFWKTINNKDVEIDNIFRLTFGYTGSDIERAFKNLIFASARTLEITYKTLKEKLIAVGNTYKKEQKYGKEWKGH